MYYQLTNGRLVTVENMRIAYEIVTGEHFDPDNAEIVQRYDAWLKSNPNVIKRFIHDMDCLSIEDLVLNGRILDATVRYRKIHGCSIGEAKSAIEQMHIKKGDSHA